MPRGQLLAWVVGAALWVFYEAAELGFSLHCEDRHSLYHSRGTLARELRMMKSWRARNLAYHLHAQCPSGRENWTWQKEPSVAAPVPLEVGSRDVCLADMLVEPCGVSEMVSGKFLNVSGVWDGCRVPPQQAGRVASLTESVGVYFPWWVSC